MIDADLYSEQTINGFLQQELDKQYGNGKMTFSYATTARGYRVTVKRQASYMINGQFIMDADCTLLTGSWIGNFRVDLANPSHRPMITVVPYGNAFYAPVREFERLYTLLLSAGDGDQVPRRVKVVACDTFVSVEVNY